MRHSGVESQSVLNLITELGIDFAQGYFIGEPAGIEEIAQQELLNCCARF